MFQKLVFPWDLASGHIYSVSLNDLIHFYGLNSEADVGIFPLISNIQFVLAVSLVKCHLVSLLSVKIENRPFPVLVKGVMPLFTDLLKLPSLTSAELWVKG